METVSQVTTTHVRWRLIALWTIQAMFIILFLYAAVTKLWSFNNFRSKLATDPFISGIAPIIAWVIPTWELVTVVMLVFFSQRLMGLISSLILMILFTLFVTLVLGFSEHVPCTCGGLLERMSWTEHLIFNLIMCILAITGIIIHRNTARLAT